MKQRTEEDRLRLAVDQITVQRDAAQKNLKQLEEVNRSLNIRRLAMYDSLMIEKLDLLGRCARIDQRIITLGLTPAMTASSKITLDGISELGSHLRKL